MKDVELKLISELMKNSRRSDRELAHAIGVSQPTISRVIAGLEKQGIIKEYTIIPDFRKLGYKLASLTFVSLKSKLTRKAIQQARETTKQDLCKECPSEIVMFERGIGMDFDGVLIAMHKDYSSYTKLKDRIKEYDFVDHLRTDSFIIDLQDEVHYRYITFSTLAENLLKSCSVAK
jgi:DNA-binding Lrp family transcriptional regulator